MIIVLDTGVISLATHPVETTNRECNEWIRSKLDNNVDIAIPEIADYELRRELVRADKKISIDRLDKLSKVFKYLPINTQAMHLAANYWAETRNMHRPTTGPKDIDADMILIAQAKQLETDYSQVVIATDNIQDFVYFIEARSWIDI